MLYCLLTKTQTDTDNTVMVKSKFKVMAPARGPISRERAGMIYEILVMERVSF